MHKLQIKKRISRRSAHEMILLFAKHGNHGSVHDSHQISFQSDADVKRFFQQNGVDYPKLVEQCRNFDKHIRHGSYRLKKR